MQEHLQQIKQLISRLISLSEAEWHDYASLFRIQTFRKKQTLLSCGTIAKDVFFINKGLLRVYLTDAEGSEKTFHFSMENTFVTDYKSLLKETPASYSIQALEDTEVVIMSREQLFYGYRVLQQGEKLGRLLAEDYFFLLNDKIEGLYTKSPLQRYHELTAQFPHIFQRVPQHYIASCLNISPVHLSRLKQNGK